MFKLNLIKCQDLPQQPQEDISINNNVASSERSDIKSMQLRLVDEFSRSARAKKQPRVNNRYCLFEHSDEEEEKNQIVRDAAIRHIKN